MCKSVTVEQLNSRLLDFAVRIIRLVKAASSVSTLRGKPKKMSNARWQMPNDK